MNEKQIKAARSLQKSLAKCSAAGLRGGVFDSSFCVWPIDAPHPESLGIYEDFFEGVEKIGGVVIDSAHRMILDGGAGN